MYSRPQPAISFPAFTRVLFGDEMNNSEEVFCQRFLCHSALTVLWHLVIRCTMVTLSDIL